MNVAKQGGRCAESSVVLHARSVADSAPVELVHHAPVHPLLAGVELRVQQTVLIMSVKFHHVSPIQGYVLTLLGQVLLRSLRSDVSMSSRW